MTLDIKTVPALARQALLITYDSGFTVIQRITLLNKINGKRYIVGAVALLIVLFSVVIMLDAAYSTPSSGEGLRLLSPYTWIVIAISLGVFCLKGATMVIPIWFIYVGLGATFQPITAVSVGFVGLVLELAVGYYVGKRLGQKRVMPIIQKSRHGMRIHGYALKNGFFSSFLARFVPGPPIDSISMLFGAVGASFTPYLLGSLLVLVPRMMLIVLLGNVALRPLQTPYLVPALIVIAVIVVIYTIIRFQKSAKKNILPYEKE
ncbi:VTT domain-containing protein [Chitinispirillales bacterium ANBcel5]|uniref:VTT domain-containing protein n=1 Tax=Cellulosispirillum alkaliphilum TaxID=3039283 RepID=UPI002A5105A1|nr:VTT domain-containing protein [Chitinispirillales bacterium ANBcel5]